MTTKTSTASPDLFIVGGTALTMNAQLEVVEHAVVQVRQGKILALHSELAFQAPRGAKVIDARGCLVTPGLINAHTHTGMTLLRGVADDLPLEQWLHERIFPLERKWGSPEFVYWGTLLACVEMIRSGTTTFNDMYYFEESAARAVHEAGLRAICGQAITEIIGVKDFGKEMVGHLDQYLDTVKDYPLVTPSIAPHSLYGVSFPIWEKVLDYASQHQLRIHLHLQETQQEVDQSLKAFGKTPTEVFESLGLWSGQVIAAHGTCVSEGDIAILGRRRVGISHNPESNLKLGTRIAPVVELRRAGVRVALGTDGAASNNNLDLLQEVDTAAKLQSFRLGAGALVAPDALRLLTSEGAQVLGWGDQLGSLEVGKAADLIAIDVRRAHAAPLYSPYSHVVYGASGADVKHSIVAGRVLMEDFRIPHLDEPGIMLEAARWGQKIQGG